MIAGDKLIRVLAKEACPQPRRRHTFVYQFGCPCRQTRRHSRVDGLSRTDPSLAYCVATVSEVPFGVTTTGVSA
jgi:hypothetical protein